MKFIGRDREMKMLQAQYDKKDFVMLILYGRRRIGKTTLLNHFLEGKDAIFYTGIESKDSQNRILFGSTVFHHFGESGVEVNFSSYADILAYITEHAKARPEERLLLVLDEYPYLAQSEPAFPSLLQREIDCEWANLNIMLILCGSSISFMEEEVLGEKSPLYGRRTAQLDLRAFDYKAAAEFVPDYSPEEKAIVFGVTGGVAKYLSLFDPAISLDQNLEEQFFSTSGFFYEEPQNLLREEFRDISLYYAVLSAIASGRNQIGEIAGKTGFDTARVVQAVQRLSSVRIVRRDVPILNETNKKLSQYVICDGMVRFWFRCVSRGISAIEQGYGAAFYERMIKPQLHDIMSLPFEDICRQYTLAQGLGNGLGVFLTKVGKWRGTDPAKKQPADIDIVGINDFDHTAVVGECKFQNQPVGLAEYRLLSDRERLIHPYRTVRELLFSLGGFTEDLQDAASREDRIRLITMDDLYRCASRV